MAYGQNAYQEAIALVQEKFRTSQDYAKEALDLSYDLLDKLVNLSGELSVPSFSISVPDMPLDIDINSVLNQERPTKPEISPNFPSPPDPVTLPSLDIDSIPKPDMSDLQLPSTNVDAGALDYSSDLLDLLKLKLFNEINHGGTALSPEVENAIWNRDYERELQAHLDGYDRIYSDFARRGFPIPSGTINALLQEHELNFTNKRIDRARDIAIKQEELAIQNLRFFIDKGIELEKTLMTFTDSFAKRVLEASATEVKAKVDLYNAQVHKYNVMVAIYKAILDGKVEELKAVVDSYRAKTEVFVNQVRAESERINAYVRTYATEVEAFRTTIGAIEAVANLGIKVYQAKIEEAIARANLYLKSVEVAIKNYEAINGMRIDTIKAVATIASHIVAGMMSAVSANASISGSGQTQSSSSEIEYHYYEET